MSDRAAFLDRARSRLATPALENLPHPLPPPAPVPRVEFAVDLTDPISAFIAKASGVGATCVRVPGAAGGAGLREAVGAIVREQSIASAVLSRDPETDGLADVLAGCGVEVRPWDVASAAACDAGITGALYGIAATGSLVLHAGRAGGRTAGLLPPRHIAVVRSSAMLPDAASVFRHVDERFGDGLPSQLVFATGPSRSADIELELTIGVHGPRQVWILILEDTQV